MQYAGWDRHAYMLADVFDAIQVLIYITLMANSDKPSRIKKPGLYPRPDSKKKPDDSQPDILLARLRGEAVNPTHEVGPRLIPLPPS